MINPETGSRIQIGLLPQVRTRLSCGGQFLVGNIASRIERCGGIEATRYIAPGNSPVDGQTGKQES